MQSYVNDPEIHKTLVLLFETVAALLVTNLGWATVSKIARDLGKVGDRRRQTEMESLTSLVKTAFSANSEGTLQQGDIVAVKESFFWNGATHLKNQLYTIHTVSNETAVSTLGHTLPLTHLRLMHRPNKTVI